MNDEGLKFPIFNISFKRFSIGFTILPDFNDKKLQYIQTCTTLIPSVYPKAHNKFFPFQNVGAFLYFQPESLMKPMQRA